MSVLYSVFQALLYFMYQDLYFHTCFGKIYTIGQSLSFCSSFGGNQAKVLSISWEASLIYLDKK